MTPIICITARVASHRLPGKIMLNIEGKPLYERLSDRLRGTYPVIWCIPQGSENDSLHQALRRIGAEVFRGPYHNVHKRIINCADYYKTNTIIRVTGDNPLTDPVIMLGQVAQHQYTGADYTYVKDAPRGTRCEVVEVDRMRLTHKNPEHLTFDFQTFANKREYRTEIGCENYRLTVDYPIDLYRIRKIYRELGDYPCLADIISLHCSENGAIKSTKR